MGVKVVLLAVVAAGIAGNVRAEEPHVATVVASVRESVAKMKAADPQAVPMAFWDFDGTIIKGDVGLGYRTEDGRCYRGLMEATMLAGLSSVYQGAEGHRRWYDDYRHFLEIGSWLSQGYDVQMYAGTSAEGLADFCEKTIRDEGIDKWYFASSMAIWKALAEMGVENYVVSANVEPLVRGVAASLGIPRDRVRAARTAVVGGRITTQILYPIPFGEGKADVVRELVGARERGVAVAGFGNSYQTDGAFLRYIVSQRNLPGGAKPLAMMVNGGSTPAPYEGLFTLVDQSETVGADSAVPNRDELAHERDAYGALRRRIVARVRLWPGLAPQETTADSGEFFFDKRVRAWRRRDVTCPELVVFKPDVVRSDTFVLDLPGGGYVTQHMGNVQGIDEALLASGRWLGILHYRIPRRSGRKIFEAPREDLARAVRWLRKYAGEYGWNPAKIGTIGYSAGGHLSVISAVSSTDRLYEPVDALDEVSPHLDFAVAVYPAYLLDDGATSPNRNRGDGAKLLPEFRFDARTPPMLLIHGDDDDIASSLGSLLVYTELHRRRIPAQLSVFSGASHGLNDNVNVRGWRQDVLDWLVSRGL